MPSNGESSAGIALPNIVLNECSCNVCRGFRQMHSAWQNQTAYMLNSFVSCYGAEVMAEVMSILLDSGFNYAKYEATLRRVNISNTVKDAIRDTISRFISDLTAFSELDDSLCDCCGARHSVHRPPASPLFAHIDEYTPAYNHLEINPPKFCGECRSTGGITFCNGCNEFWFSSLFDPDSASEEMRLLVRFDRDYGGYSTVAQCNDCRDGVANPRNNRSHDPEETVECAGCHESLGVRSQEYAYSHMFSDDRMLCQHCFNSGSFHQRCALCGRHWITEGSSESVRLYPGIGNVCTRCSTDNDLLRCERCNNWFVDRSGYGLCQCQAYVVHNYTFKPTPAFKFDPKRERLRNTTYYGVELEFSPPSGDGTDNALVLGVIFRDIPELRNLFYVKNDASTNNGFEFVSHPFSWYWINQKEQQMLVYNLFQLLVDKFGYSGDNNHCGMHVHVSRTWFQASRLYKVLRMFYGFPLFAEKVAGRSIQGMSRYATLEPSGADDLLRKAQLQEDPYANRGAVNLRNERTIEFRLFRGVKSADVMYRNLEYLDALREYVSVAAIADMNPYSFKDWIMNGELKNSPVSKQYSRVYNHLQTFVI